MKSVVFMGTPDFAVPALKCLIENDNYDVKLVVSQTDKAQGRHKEIVFTPVKQLALQYDIEVYQPKTLKSDEAYDKIKSVAPDFIVVAAYGKILPQRVLDIPFYGCVNIHGSLLPRYRGAAPIQWCVINGEKETGLTTMLMDAGLDTGDILCVEKTEIGVNETAGELFDRLADMGSGILLKTLELLENGSVTPVKQDEKEATYVSVLTKEMALIDWEDDAGTVHNKVRGMYPWPVAFTVCRGKLLKIYSTLRTERKAAGVPGSVTLVGDRLFVNCGNNTALEICELQIEGKKRMNTSDFIRGHQISADDILGNKGDM